AVIGQRTDQEPFEQVVDQLVEGVESLNARHVAISFSYGASAPYRKGGRVIPRDFKTPVNFADEGLSLRPVRTDAPVRRARWGLLVCRAAGAGAGGRAGVAPSGRSGRGAV